MHMASPSSLAVRSQAVARKVGRHVVRQLRKVVASSNEPLLSVVMPAHNVQGYLEESVRSVLAQDYPNLEIIIVEDGFLRRTVPPRSPTGWHASPERCRSCRCPGSARHRPQHRGSAGQGGVSLVR